LVRANEHGEVLDIKTRVGFGRRAGHLRLRPRASWRVTPCSLRVDEEVVNHAASGSRSSAFSEISISRAVATSQIRARLAERKAVDS
jgi:hypothetical protein